MPKRNASTCRNDTERKALRRHYSESTLSQNGMERSGTERKERNVDATEAENATEPPVAVGVPITATRENASKENAVSVGVTYRDGFSFLNIGAHCRDCGWVLSRCRRQPLRQMTRFPKHRFRYTSDTFQVCLRYVSDRSKVFSDHFQTTVF